MERQPGDALLLKQTREPNALQTVGWEAMIYKAFQALPVSHPLRRCQYLFSNMTMTKACWSFALSRTRAHWRRNKSRPDSHQAGGADRTCAGGCTALNWFIAG